MVLYVEGIIKALLLPEIVASNNFRKGAYYYQK